MQKKHPKSEARAEKCPKSEAGATAGATLQKKRPKSEVSATLQKKRLKSEGGTEVHVECARRKSSRIAAKKESADGKFCPMLHC